MAILAQSSLPFTSATDTLLGDAAFTTDDLSGAQVREVAYLALQYAILRTTDAEGPAQLTGEDRAGAIDRVAAKKDAGSGFHTGIETPL